MNFGRKNLSGLIYFYIHFVVEVFCFYALSLLVGDNYILWVIPLIYDALAFVPQALIGYLSDKIPKIPVGMIGMILLMIGLSLFGWGIVSIYVSISIIAIGNAFVHVAGAEATLRSSSGKIAPSAIFVAGGSFGVITGKLLAGVAPVWFILMLGLSTIPLIIIMEKYRKKFGGKICTNFDYVNEKVPVILIIAAAVLVVAIRGYMGYGIPTSWNKTIIQTILLYVFMGIGKALGGILCDKIGLRKTALISVVGALPFLLFGDNIMVVSLIGVLMFSMTMSITLAILVSVLKKTPGFAFGLTTIGLFLGSLPIFFVKISSLLINCIIIIISSLICLLILATIIKKETKKDEKNS